MWDEGQTDEGSRLASIVPEIPPASAMIADTANRTIDERGLQRPPIPDDSASPRSLRGWRCASPCVQAAYLNGDRAFSESLVAPRSRIRLSFTSSALDGTTTYVVPMPRKPPTDSTAKGTLLVGVTIRSSTVPTASLASL